MRLALLSFVAIIVCMGFLIYLPACESEVELSPAEAAAVQEYADRINEKIDLLYAKFEQGEMQAKWISDENMAPYNMAIGYMAEVRKTADEVEALTASEGAAKIRETALSKLRELQEGLNEIASKGPDDVSLSDPSRFYTAYLDVLLELPELKQEILNLAK